MQEYGIKIKKLRKEKGYTLRQLAEKTGLSVGFLSKIEHCSSTPSYPALQKICFALDVTSSVFESGKPSLPEAVPTVLTKEDRALIYSNDGGFKLESLFADREAFEITVMTLTGNGDRENVSRHRTNEFGVVLSGTLCTTIDGKDYIARPQECMLIPKETVHSTKKLGSEDCVSVWIRYR